MEKREVVRLLKEKSIGLTVPRIEIAHFLLQQPQHLSADEILERVNAKYHRVSKATIYNTLNLFVKEGLINEVLVDSGRVLYDSNTKPHHHFYDPETGELIDIDQEMVSIQCDAPLPAGFDQKNCHLVIQVVRAS